MKKIATITFHASYNYGSNLQAYALQEYIKKICRNYCLYKIVNLRIDKQKEIYMFPYERKNIVAIIKTLILIKHIKKLKEKKINFETFINKKLNLTKEYNSMEELNDELFDFDYYISGSDQIWNLRAGDFDWSYFLEFVRKGKKISYATSFGPLKQKWTIQDMERIKNDLKQYDFISVREKGSYDNVLKLANIKPNINIDPTLLLTKEEWYKVIDKKKLVNKDYILLYDLKDCKLVFKIAKKLSKKFNIPIIVTKPNKYDLIYRVEKHYECGPLEFLNLLKNAKIVLTTSFHGAVFSILFNKPFYTIECNNDFRIKTLLEITKLKNRNINNDNINDIYENIFDVNFEMAEKLIDLEREKSKEYLKNAVDIKE